MAKLFNNRTENDIKNKWYSMKRKDERNKNKAFQGPLEGNPFVADMTIDVSSVPCIPDQSKDPRSSVSCIPDQSKDLLHSKLGASK
jgi:hypothetical protein